MMTIINWIVWKWVFIHSCSFFLVLGMDSLDCNTVPSHINFRVAHVAHYGQQEVGRSGRVWGLRKFPPAFLHFCYSQWEEHAWGRHYSFILNPGWRVMEQIWTPTGTGIKLNLTGQVSSNPFSRAPDYIKILEKETMFAVENQRYWVSCSFII